MVEIHCDPQFLFRRHRLINFFLFRMKHGFALIRSKDTSLSHRVVGSRTFIAFIEFVELLGSIESENGLKASSRRRVFAS